VGRWLGRTARVIDDENVPPVFVAQQQLLENGAFARM
jgi:hypothetical protein